MSEDQSNPVLLYTRQYVWYLLASVFDIVVTYIIVWRLDGSEVNVIANNLIEVLGHWGLVFLKFTTVVLVVGVCELVGRRREALGRRLAVAAIVISGFPVGYGALQVWAWTHATEVVEG